MTQDQLIHRYDAVMMNAFGAPKRVFVVHGEADASEALRERIQRELGWEVSVPLQGQQFEL